MHRTSLLTLLHNYHPYDLQEQADKETMIRFVQEHPDCFQRTLLIGHMTASAWLVNRDNTHVLLTLHAKLGQWLQLGGHCDGESDVLAVALKEAQEESGIMHIVPVSSDIFDIGVHDIPAHKDVPAHVHYDVRFLLQVASDEQIIQSGESTDLRWFSRDINSLSTSNRSIVRMFTKWRVL
jgi:8-oxo-dGTP pyrophosphatase MutT (NUDIX family)